MSFLCESDAPPAPVAPDPQVTADAQTAANIKSAFATAQINNPNISNPYGTSSTQYGVDAFFAANPSVLAEYRADSGGFTPLEYAKQYSSDRPGMANAYSEYTPFVKQTLTPESQKIFETQQQTKQQLADLGNLGAKNATAVFSTPFAFNAPAANTTIADAGEITLGPNAANFMANAGPSAANFMAGGGPSAANFMANRNLDLSNVAAMPINAGMTAQQAIMARLEPQIAKQRVSTETQLINQGLRPGSEAYNNAITLLAQQENDQRTQAVLQGLGLDLSANAQGYGQALTSGQFGNTAQAQNFGQGNIQQQLFNQAQAQNFGQGTTAQNTANQAAGQNYTQNFNTVAQNNAAQQQKFAQNTQQAAFENQARQQALAEAIQQRQMPINEISAFMSGSQIQNPVFQPYTGANVAAAPIAQTMQNAYLGAQNQYNQQIASNNQEMGGLFDIGKAVLPYFLG
jgi:hypothetical protein